MVCERKTHVFWQLLTALFDGKSRTGDAQEGRATAAMASGEHSNLPLLQRTIHLTHGSWCLTAVISRLISPAYRYVTRLNCCAYACVHAHVSRMSVNVCWLQLGDAPTRPQNTHPDTPQTLHHQSTPHLAPPQQPTLPATSGTATCAPVCCCLPACLPARYALPAARCPVVARQGVLRSGTLSRSCVQARTRAGSARAATPTTPALRGGSHSTSSG